MSDPTDDLLKALPACDTDEGTAERVRKMAVAAFVAERDLASPLLRRSRFRAGLIRAGRVAMPVFLAGTAGAYITWAIVVAGSLYN